jgi:hypothetical protein
MSTFGLKTDAKLLKALGEASARRLSAREMHAQRVSYVYGSMKQDSVMTKERVKQLLEEKEGIATECADGTV